MIKLTIPISDEEISKLRVGDQVSLSGVIVTARDRAHKFVVDNFIKSEPPTEEKELQKELAKIFNGGVIYHCGPIVRKLNGSWEFVSAGPTTSTRAEAYEPQIIEKFNLKGVIGKGGMGPKTLRACQDYKAVYIHTVGGAGSSLAQCVKEVLAVYKMEFGVPEAFWKIRVEDFPGVVTMDSYGASLHEEIEKKSREMLNKLIV